MRRWLTFAAVGGGLVLALWMLADMGGKEWPSPSAIASLAASPADFSTGLHATRQGKATFYSKENGGFETLTGIPMSNLGCQKCHAATYADGTPVDPATYQPDCKDCHVQVGDTPSQDVCLGCHSRQKVEMGMFSDVHREMGFTCMDCHTSDDVHGDGTVYASMLEPGAIDAKCVNCHETLADNPYHNTHREKLDCTACHAQSVSTCYNCHFDSMTAGAGKRFLKPPRVDFQFLVNRDGKVHSATMQSLVFQGQSFYTIAPFTPHTISRKAVEGCDDCHSNAAVKEYTETGKITVTRWDADEGKLIGPEGVIPVPPDWQEALQLDFLDYTGDAANPETDPTKWVFLKHGADLVQMLYAEPLTEEQMEKLSAF